MVCVICMCARTQPRGGDPVELSGWNTTEGGREGVPAARVPKRKAAQLEGPFGRPPTHTQTHTQPHLQTRQPPACRKVTFTQSGPLLAETGCRVVDSDARGWRVHWNSWQRPARHRGGCTHFSGRSCGEWRGQGGARAGRGAGRGAAGRPTTHAFLSPSAQIKVAPRSVLGAMSRTRRGGAGRRSGFPLSAFLRARSSRAMFRGRLR